VIDPILSFMKGSNKALLDQAKRLLEDHQANLGYVQADELAAIEAALVNLKIYKGNAIQTLVANMQALQGKLDEAIERERTSAISKVEALESVLTQYEGFTSLNSEQQDELTQRISTVKQRINEQNLIAVVRDLANSFENEHYEKLLQQILNWNAPVPQPANAASGNQATDSRENKDTKAKDTDTDSANTHAACGTWEPAIKQYPPVTSTEIISAKELQVSFTKPFLETEADVEAYLDSYRNTLLASVSQGKKVRV